VPAYGRDEEIYSIIVCLAKEIRNWKLDQATGMSPVPDISKDQAARMPPVPNIGIRGRPSHSALCNLQSALRPPSSALRPPNRGLLHFAHNDNTRSFFCLSPDCEWDILGGKSLN